MAFRFGARARFVLLAVAMETALPASWAAAAEPGEQTVFADAGGVAWGVATFEVAMALVPLSLAVSDCSSWDCIGLASLHVLGSLVLSVGVGVVTQATEAPPDVPLALHHAVLGGLLGYGVGMTTCELTVGGCDSAAGWIGAGVVGALGITYVAASRDHLIRNPDTAQATHWMSWGPALGAIIGLGIGQLIADLVGGDDDVVAVTAVLLAVGVYGIGLGVAEAER
jgi:hypothetical protein